ncbi:MAG: MATE family efflux transporter [Natronospirillum sp.]
MTRQQQVLQDDIGTLIRRLSAPMALGIMGIMLFTLVDTWFIALLGTTELAAVSFTFPVTFAVMSLAMGFSVGMAAVLGRILGAGQQRRAARVTTDGLLLSTLLISLLALLGLFTIQPLFTHMGADAETLVHIEAYMSVWYLAVPLLVIPMVGNSAIRATGDTKTPSVVMLLSGVLNGVLDPLLIFGPGPFPALGVQGAALATAISWSVTLLAAYYVLRYREKLLIFTLPGWATLWSNWRALLRIGVPAALSQMMIPIINGFIVSLLAVYGTTAVAAYGVGTRLEALFIVLMMAVSSVVPIVVGQNLGAGQFERARTALLYSTHYALRVQALLYGVIFLLAPWVAGFFSRDPAVIELATFYLRVMPLCYGLLGVTFMFTQTLNALHLPLASMGINLGRLFLVNLPLVLLGSWLFGAKGIFIGVCVAHCLMGIGLYVYVRWFLVNSVLMGSTKGPQLDIQPTEDEVAVHIQAWSTSAFELLLPALGRLPDAHPNRTLRLELHAPATLLDTLERRINALKLPHSKVNRTALTPG